MRFLITFFTLILSACGSDDVIVEKRADVSYADIQPAAGMTYPEYRQHEIWGQGDMLTAQKRFMILDRDNNGRLSDDELGGAQ